MRLAPSPVVLPLFFRKAYTLTRRLQPRYGRAVLVHMEAQYILYKTRPLTFPGWLRQHHLAQSLGIVIYL